MTDPLDTIEAILDQLPAKFGNWTADDFQAVIHASEMLIAEWEAFEPGDTPRFERLQELQKMYESSRGGSA